MTKFISAISALALGVVTVSTIQAAGWNPDEVDKAQETIELFKKADPTMDRFFEKAYGYAIFPSVTKGAFFVGGARGRGIVFESGQPVGRSTLTGGTFGLQVGGQSFSQVVFFEKESDLAKFQSGNVAFTARATAVAASNGAAAVSSYASGVAVFTMARGGLMAEASLGGQKFGYESFTPQAQPVEEVEVAVEIEQSGG